MKKFRGVALCGNKGVGKTTLTEYLKRSFLINSTHPKSLFGSMVTPIMLKMGVPVDELEARVFTERIEDPLPEPYEHVTTRRLLQAAGGGFLDDLGIRGLAHSLTLPSPRVPVVIESVRRVDEATWLREQGFALVGLNRPSTSASLEHSTEVDLSGIDYDYVITNDDSIDSLHRDGAAMMANVMSMIPKRRDHALLVINGRPRSGKDSLTNMLKLRCEEMEIRFEFLSSIEPVRQMLTTFGVDVSAKTAADRDLLAAVKSALEKYDGRTTRWLLDAFTLAKSEAPKDRLLFVTHVREHEQISHLVEAVGDSCVAMWINRPGVRESGATNSSDRTTAANYDYPLMLSNEGTLLDLDEYSSDLLQQVFCVS